MESTTNQSQPSTNSSFLLPPEFQYPSRFNREITAIEAGLNNTVLDPKEAVTQVPANGVAATIDETQTASLVSVPVPDELDVPRSPVASSLNDESVSAAAVRPRVESTHVNPGKRESEDFSDAGAHEYDDELIDSSSSSEDDDDEADPDYRHPRIPSGRKPISSTSVTRVVLKVPVPSEQKNQRTQQQPAHYREHTRPEHQMAVKKRRTRRKLKSSPGDMGPEIRLPKQLWRQYDDPSSFFPSFVRPFPWKEHETVDLPNLILEFVPSDNTTKTGRYRKSECFFNPCDGCKKRKEPCYYRSGLRKCLRCAKSKNACRRMGQDTMKNVGNVSARRDKINNVPDHGPVNAIQFLEQQSGVPSSEFIIGPELLLTDAKEDAAPPVSESPAAGSSKMSVQYSTLESLVRRPLSAPTKVDSRPITRTTPDRPIHRTAPDEPTESPTDERASIRANSTADEDDASMGSPFEEEIVVQPYDEGTHSITRAALFDQFVASGQRPTAMPRVSPPSRPLSSGAPKPTAPLTLRIAPLSVSSASKPPKDSASQAGNLKRKKDVDSPPASATKLPRLERAYTSDLDQFKHSIFLDARFVEVLGNISATSEEAIFDGAGPADAWSRTLRLAAIRLLNVEFYRECFKVRTQGTTIKMKREIGHQFELMLKLFSDTAFEAGVLVRRVAQDEDEWPFEAMPDASEHEPSTKFDDYKRECFAGRGPVPYLNGDLTQVSADGVYEGGEGSGEWSETLRLVMLCLMDLEWHKISLEDSMKVKQKRAIKEQVELLLKDNLNAVEECRVLLRRLAEHEDVWPINLRAQ